MILSNNSKLTLDKNGVYCSNFSNKDQVNEIKMREGVANLDIGDYLQLIAKNHSIPVMDYEVRRMLKRLPLNAKIIDVGGCWGWHWRFLSQIRPDVTVYILDFVYENLSNVRKVIPLDCINKSVFLIHGDATNLPFDNESFDCYWSVQCLQHIPDFRLCISEAYRVLSKNGLFINYSLNNVLILNFIYKLLKRYYHINGEIAGITLNKASAFQVEIIKSIFSRDSKFRFTELLFHPELSTISGKEFSIIGKLDSYLGGYNKFLRILARQQSFEITK